MRLGALAFAWPPDRWTMPDPKQVMSVVDTYSSNIVFFYGAKLIGKKIDLEWNFMGEVQFDALDTLYQADLPLTWDLEEVLDTRTFTVEILSVDGALLDVALWDQPYREKVKVSLLILAVQDTGS